MGSNASGTDIPPTDHVGRALFARGAREHGLDLLRAAVARDPGEMACAALLRVALSRPETVVSGPAVELNMVLVDNYVRRGMLLEARAVLRATELGAEGDGLERLMALEEVLGPLPADADPRYGPLFEPLGTGGAAVVLATLDQGSWPEGGGLPLWASRRHALLRDLLLGDVRSSDSNQELGALATTVVATALEGWLRRHDLHSGYADLCRYADKHPSDGEAAAARAALGRLLSAVDRLSTDFGGSIVSTQPMEGASLAFAQVRMGNLSEAERLFRREVLHDPGHEEARVGLADVQMLRRLVDGVSPDAERASPALELAPIVTPIVVKSRELSSKTISFEEESTDAMAPNVKAEVLFQAGYNDRALDIYRQLVEREPRNRRHQERLAEIEALVRSQPTVVGKPPARSVGLSPSQPSRADEPSAPASSGVEIRKIISIPPPSRD